SRRLDTIFSRDWSSDVCSSDLNPAFTPMPVSSATRSSSISTSATIACSGAISRHSICKRRYAVALANGFHSAASAISAAAATAATPITAAATRPTFPTSRSRSSGSNSSPSTQLIRSILLVFFFDLRQQRVQKTHIVTRELRAALIRPAREFAARFKIQRAQQLRDAQFQYTPFADLRRDRRLELQIRQLIRIQHHC